MLTDSLPSRIDRFEVDALLGEGSVAKVYKAFDPKMKRDVAIKILQPQYAGEQQYRLRFTCEAEAAGSVSDHPSIATLYEVGEFNNQPYIVMEYGGDTNLEQCGQQQTLAWKIKQLITIAEALHFAHQRGIVHRDIKPANIICREDGGLRVTDFGIASALSPTAKALDEEWLVGSPHYMAPEQIAGEPIDGRTDVFSLGVLLYELLSGYLPFGGQDFDALSEHIRHDPHRPLGQDIPQPLRDIVERCLAKSPGDRFASAAELASTLKTFLLTCNEPVDGHAIHSNHHKTRITHTASPQRFGILLATVIIISVLCGAWLVDQQQKHIRQSVINQGIHFGTFLAQHSSEPLLLIEEQGAFALNQLLNQLGAQSSLSHIVITDNQGIAKASSHSEPIDQPYVPPHRLWKTQGKTDIYQSPDGEEIQLHFPIKVQNQIIGQVYLSMNPRAENTTLSTTLRGYSVAISVVILAVVLLYYSHIPSAQYARVKKALQKRKAKTPPTINKTDTMSKHTHTKRRRKRRRVTHPVATTTPTSVASNPTRVNTEEVSNV